MLVRTSVSARLSSESQVVAEAAGVVGVALVVFLAVCWLWPYRALRLALGLATHSIYWLRVNGRENVPARRRAAGVQPRQLSRLAAAPGGAAAFPSSGGLRRLDETVGRASFAPLGRGPRHRRLGGDARPGPRSAAGPRVPGTRRTSMSLRRGPGAAGRPVAAIPPSVRARRSQERSADRAGLSRSNAGQSFRGASGTSRVGAGR